MSDDPNAMLTREEFEDAVKSMKNGKAVGRDKIPAEVWKIHKLSETSSTNSCKRFGKKKK